MTPHNIFKIDISETLWNDNNLCKKYIKVEINSFVFMNSIVQASSSGITIRLLKVGGGDSDRTLNVPFDFLNFACRNTWLDCAGQAATSAEDILKLGVIEMPVTKKYQYYVSFQEMKDWYDIQDTDERNRIDHILEKFNNLFTFRQQIRH